jgi:hypothetical protein
MTGPVTPDLVLGFVGSIPRPHSPARGPNAGEEQLILGFDVGMPISDEVG